MKALADAIIFVAVLVFVWACMGFPTTGPVIGGPCGGGGGSGKPVPVIPDSITQ